MIRLIFLALGCAFLVANTYGNKISEDQQAYAAIKGTGLVVSPENALINTDPEPSLSRGFVDLFNGEDLKGWTPRVGYSKYEVRDGVIVGSCVPGSRNTYLSTEREDYRDFIFTAELKWAVDGNSGIMFRAQRKPGKKYEVVYGPQCEMEGFAKGRGWSGGIYGQSAGGWIYPLWLNAHAKARRALKEDVWNRVTIQAIGNEVKTWINGIPAAHWIDKDGEYREGFFGLQVHSGDQGEIHFRNIKVREL
jgi:hypothetical protein